MNISLMRSIFAVFGFFLFICGIGGFFSALITHVGFGDKLNGIELPLGDAEGVIVDRKSRIYVGSRSYRRVHRYFKDGEFDRAWHVPAGKGEWWFYLDGEDNLYLAIGAGDYFTYYKLNENEKLVRASTLPKNSPQRFDTNAFINSENKEFILEPLFFRVQSEKNGELQPVVSQGIFKILFAAPLPAWIVAFIGLVIIGITVPTPNIGKKSNSRKIR